MKEVKDVDMENLTLLMIYLSSWDENLKKEFGEEPVLRAWKGFTFEILDELNKKGLISGSKGRKSVYLTDEGIKKAKGLLGRIQESGGLFR
ncbi:MAG: transposase [Candidatus Aenigmarchaeota archaeon]|nr:transposase [Candidatus Aenigmarchaeota archaeon]